MIKYLILWIYYHAVHSLNRDFELAMFFKGSQEIESQIEPKKDASLDLAVIKIPFVCEVISSKFNPNNVVETPIESIKQFEVTKMKI